MEQLPFNEAIKKIKALKVKKHAKLGFWYRMLELESGSTGQVVLTIFRPPHRVVKENR
jgi:hypothetical protein